MVLRRTIFENEMTLVKHYHMTDMNQSLLHSHGTADNFLLDLLNMNSTTLMSGFFFKNNNKKRIT